MAAHCSKLCRPWPRLDRFRATAPRRHGEVVVFDLHIHPWLHEIIFGQRRPEKRELRSGHQARSMFDTGEGCRCHPANFCLEFHPRAKESHDTLGGRLTAAGQARNYRGRDGESMKLCRHKPGRGRRRPVCHAQRAGATLAHTGRR